MIPDAEILYRVNGGGLEPVTAREVREEIPKRWLRRAHEAAAVVWIPGRAWHGIKRTWATLSDGLPGRARQAGTLPQTLDMIYAQDDREQMLEVAKHIEDARGREAHRRDDRVNCYILFGYFRVRNPCARCATVALYR
jgi:hypothetical protein